MSTEVNTYYQAVKQASAAKAIAYVMQQHPEGANFKASAIPGFEGFYSVSYELTEEVTD